MSSLSDFRTKELEEELARRAEIEKNLPQMISKIELKDPAVMMLCDMVQTLFRELAFQDDTTFDVESEQAHDLITASIAVVYGPEGARWAKNKFEIA